MGTVSGGGAGWRGGSPSHRHCCGTAGLRIQLRVLPWCVAGGGDICHQTQSTETEGRAGCPDAQVFLLGVYEEGAELLPSRPHLPANTTDAALRLAVLPSQASEQRNGLVLSCTIKKTPRRKGLRQVLPQPCRQRGVSGWGFGHRNTQGYTGSGGAHTRGSPPRQHHGDPADSSVGIPGAPGTASPASSFCPRDWGMEAGVQAPDSKKDPQPGKGQQGT